MYIILMVDIGITDEFGAWFAALNDKDADAVAFVVDLLEERGVTLGHPYSSDIKGSRIALRELRIQSRGHAFRVFYAFDPLRRAVLLIGGDKTGQKRFYEIHVKKAENLWVTYLRETQQH